MTARRLLLVPALVLALGGAACAADPAAGGEHRGYGEPSIRAIGVQLLGITILAIILGKFAAPLAIEALRARRERIRETLEGLERSERAHVSARSEAERGLKDAERGSLDRMERAASEGATLRQELVEEGEEQALKIGKKAKLEAEIERQKMLLELRNEVVELSFAAAETLLREGVDRKVQDELVDRFIEDLRDATEARKGAR